MKEIYTRALVLNRRPLGEQDGLVSFFTQDFGKIVARARSIRKPTSKLSAHLQPLSFVKIRFVKLGDKEIFLITDCVWDDALRPFQTHKRYDMLNMLSFVNAVTFDLQTDRRLWHFLEEVFKHHYNLNQIIRGILQLLGHDPTGATCRVCKKNADIFVYHDESFLCQHCAQMVPKEQYISISS